MAGSLDILRKYFIKIIIPYAIFSLVGITVYALKWNLTTERIGEMLFKAALGIRNQVPITSLWFLPCLFVVIAYYTLANLLIKKAWAIFLIALVINQPSP